MGMLIAQAEESQRVWNFKQLIEREARNIIGRRIMERELDSIPAQSQSDILS